MEAENIKLLFDNINSFKRKGNFFHNQKSGISYAIHKNLFAKLLKYKKNKNYFYRLVNNNEHMIFIKWWKMNNLKIVIAIIYGEVLVWMIN